MDKKILTENLHSYIIESISNSEKLRSLKEYRVEVKMVLDVGFGMPVNNIYSNDEKVSYFLGNDFWESNFKVNISKLCRELYENPTEKFNILKIEFTNESDVKIIYLWDEEMVTQRFIRELNAYPNWLEKYTHTFLFEEVRLCRSKSKEFSKRDYSYSVINGEVKFKGTLYNDENNEITNIRPKLSSRLIESILDYWELTNKGKGKEYIPEWNKLTLIVSNSSKGIVDSVSHEKVKL